MSDSIPCDPKKEIFILSWDHRKLKWDFMRLDEQYAMCGRCESEVDIIEEIFESCSEVPRYLTIYLLKELIEQLR